MAELEPLARQGDPQAMYYLGILIGDGLSGAANPAEGFRLFQQSAEKGSDDGQNAFGYS